MGKANFTEGVSPSPVITFDDLWGRGLSPARHQTEQIANAVGVAPLVIVPAETLEVLAAGNARERGVENR